MPRVAIIAQGAMGAGIAGRLSENGVEVLTSLAGRSAASRARAEAAGMRDVPTAELAGADLFLSIVPPAEALGLARTMAPLLAAAQRKPVYVDCNAVDVPTVRAVEAALAGTGCAFADGGIIGAPPKAGGASPRLYVSGAQARRVAELAIFGLDVRITPGEVGAASALKMSYAGITKGITGLAAIMLSAAAREGTAEALRAELAESQPEFLAWFRRQVPAMFPKAHRWVAEMQEIAAFLHEDPAGAALFEAEARLYERLAADHAGEGLEAKAITSVLASGG